MNCIPQQKAMTYLWQEMAKNRNHTELVDLVRPIAMPSKTAWRLNASMTKKPLKAAYKIDDDIKACPTVFKVAKDNLPGDLGLYSKP